MKDKKSQTGLDIAQLENSANRLKSIAHPMRIAILELLREKEKLSVTEIYSYLKLEQAVASNHLSILKEKGVLFHRIEHILIQKNHHQMLEVPRKILRHHSTNQDDLLY